MKLRSLFAASAITLSSLLCVVLPVQAEKSNLNMDELLTLVKKGQARDNNEFNSRLKRFNDAKFDQQRLLSESQAERTKLENLSAKKEITDPCPWGGKTFGGGGFLAFYGTPGRPPFCV